MRKGTMIVPVRLKHSQWLVLLLLFLLSSCSKGELYSNVKGIDNATWDKHDSYDFAVNVSDVSKRYNVFVEIRNNDEYSFRNLWLFVNIKTPEGVVRKDTLNCELADNEGKWHGNGMSLHMLSLPYEQGISYHMPGVYLYSIKQGMRSDQLKGISDIGLRVVEQTNQ